MPSPPAAIIGGVRYRAVLFDLDDTLIPEAPAVEVGFAAVAERIWGSASAQRVDELWSAARRVLEEQAPAQEYLRAVHITEIDLLHGEVIDTGPEAAALREFVPTYLQHAFDPVLPADRRPMTRELVELWCETRLSALTVYPETVGVLERLHGTVALGAVTNGLSSLQRAKLARTGLDGYFDTVVVAEDVGAAKPEPAMFRETLRRLGVPPAAAVMVGNDAERDVAGGRAAGLDTIHVVREGAAQRAETIASLLELEPALERAR